MKLTKYFMPLAAVALLASCTDEKVLDQPNEGIDQPNVSGEMVAMFTVNLPSLNDTRAITSSDFEDGLPSEYKVNDVTFYIFKKGSAESEDDYECVGISETYYPVASGSTKDDISRTVTITVQIKDDEFKNIDTSKEDYYGLCIINKPNSTFEPSVKKESDGTKFGAWKKTLASFTDFKHDNGFTMTNAPTFDEGEDQATTPNTSNITTLVHLTAKNIVKAPLDPPASAGTFYVQRGVSKAAVKGASNVSLDKIPSKVNPDHSFLLENWILDVTNKSAFPVQVVNMSAALATVGTPEFDFYKVMDASAKKHSTTSAPYFYTAKSGNIDFSHLWWATDPNYTVDTSLSPKASDFNTASSVDDSWNTVNYDGSTPDAGVSYCLENTMPHDGMTQNQTTRVLFKGKYSLGKKGQNGNPVYESFILDQYGKAVSVEGIVKNTVTTSNGSIALNDLINDVYYKGDGYTGPDFGEVSDYADYYDEQPSQAGELGKIKVLKVICLSLGLNPAGTDKVAYYKGGETYYVALVKHFDPTQDKNETYWEAPDNATDQWTASQLYTEQHTGRYGMLRNNVYYINVQQVTGYGSPTIPTPGNTPDDEIEPVLYNMEVTINVLKWAKRDYGYDLK